MKSIIKRIEFVGETSPDDLIFSKSAVELLHSSTTITAVGRWGKQLWLTLDDPFVNSKVLLMHLGMTAFVQFKRQKRLPYKSSPSNKKSMALEEVWPPKFTKLIIEFDDCVEMAFCDARRLAKVDTLEISDPTNIEHEVKSKFKLGFDPLISVPDREEFECLIIPDLKRKINIKTLLMQQSFMDG